MAKRIVLFEHAFAAGVVRSATHDIGDAEAVVLQLVVDDWGGSGTPTAAVEVSNDRVTWFTLEEVDFTGAGAEKRNYAEGLLQWMRVTLTPAPTPWETDGVFATVTASASLRGAGEPEPTG